MNSSEINGSVRRLLVLLAVLIPAGGVAHNTQTMGPAGVSTPECAELRQKRDIDLASYSDWEVETSSGVSAEIYRIDTEGEGRFLVIEYDANAESDVAPQIVVRSAQLSSEKMRGMKEASLRLSSNSDGKARIIFKDRNGNAFFSQAPIRMNRAEWQEERRSYSVDALVYHGSNREFSSEFDPVPPYSVDHVRIGLPQGYKAEGKVRLSDMGVYFSRTDDRIDSGGSPYNDWLEKICRHQAGPDSFVDVKIPYFDKPVEVGTSIPVNVEYNASSGFGARLEVSIKRYALEGKEVLEDVSNKSTGGDVILALQHVTESPGLYAVVAELSMPDGRLLARDSAQFMVWNPPGNSYEDTTPNFFGMMYQERFSDSWEQDLDLMAKAGVRIVRFPFRWSEIEPEKGKYQWAKYDRLMQLIKSKSMVAQPMVFYTPAWAARANSGSGDFDDNAGKYRWAVPSVGHFAEFFGRAVERYKKQGVIWEIYNEPTEPQHWIGGDEKDYVDIFNAAVEEAGRRDPSVKVITAGIGFLSATDKEFSPYLINHMSENTLGVSVHSYGGEAEAEMNLDHAESLIRKYGRNVEIWLNETGFLVDPEDPEGELRRAESMVKTAILSRFNRVNNFSWFIYRNYPASAESATDNHALLAADNSVRYPLLAYANIANSLVNTSPVKKGVLGKNVEYYQFETPDKHIMVAWLDQDAGYELIEIPTDNNDLDLIQVIDMFGGEIKLDDDQKVISQSKSPTFLIYDKK